jgi:hypothetical protein
MKTSMATALLRPLPPLAVVLAALWVLLIPVAGAQTPCAPGITFGSLLGSLRVGYGDGRLQVEKLYAVCLPPPARQSKTNYPYEPDDGGLLSMRVKHADGQLLSTYVWYAERIGTLWELSRYKVVGGHESVKPLGAGDYLLEFAADDKLFGRFAFSVVTVKSDDPYQAAGNRYFIEGPWNEYGNLYYQRNDPQSSLVFTTWVQERSGHQGKRSVPYEIKLIRSRNGQVLADEAATLRLEPRWLTVTLYFHPANGDRNSFYKAADVLNEDGEYHIRFVVDGKLHGEYPFTVKNGQIQLQGRQVWQGTEPLDYITDYIAGGRYTSWWLKRETRGGR